MGTFLSGSLVLTGIPPTNQCLILKIGLCHTPPMTFCSGFKPYTQRSCLSYYQSQCKYLVRVHPEHPSQEASPSLHGTTPFVALASPPACPQRSVSQSLLCRRTFQTPKGQYPTTSPILSSTRDTNQISKHFDYGLKGFQSKPCGLCGLAGARPRQLYHFSPPFRTLSSQGWKQTPVSGQSPVRSSAPSLASMRGLLAHLLYFLQECYNVGPQFL